MLTGLPEQSVGELATALTVGGIWTDTETAAEPVPQVFAAVTV